MAGFSLIHRAMSSPRIPRFGTRWYGFRTHSVPRTIAFGQAYDSLRQCLMVLGLLDLRKINQVLDASKECPERWVVSLRTTVRKPSGLRRTPGLSKQQSVHLSEIRHSHVAASNRMLRFQRSDGLVRRVGLKHHQKQAGREVRFGLSNLAQFEGSLTCVGR